MSDSLLYDLLRRYIMQVYGVPPEYIPDTLDVKVERVYWHDRKGAERFCKRKSQLFTGRGIKKVKR